MCANGRVGQAHIKKYESSGISAMAWLNMSAVVSRSQRNPKRKRHTKLKNENVERGCARADSEGIKNEVTKLKENKKSVTATNPNAHCEEEPEAGERNFLSPKGAVPESRLSRVEDEEKHRTKKSRRE